MEVGGLGAKVLYKVDACEEEMRAKRMNEDVHSYKINDITVARRLDLNPSQSRSIGCLRKTASTIRTSDASLIEPKSCYNMMYRCSTPYSHIDNANQTLTSASYNLRQILK